LSWVEDGKVKLLNLETGEVSEVQDGQQVVWSPEQHMEGHGHLKQNDQRWWLTPDEVQPNLMTAQVPLSALSAVAEETFWANQVTHEPLDWEIDPEFGQSVNLSAAGEWLTSVLSVSTDSPRDKGGPTVEPPPPACLPPNGGLMCIVWHGTSVEIWSNVDFTITIGWGENMQVFSPDNYGGLYYLSFEDDSGGNFVLWDGNGPEGGVRFRDVGNQVVKYDGT
jgi:hypothetical protein